MQKEARFVANFTDKLRKRYPELHFFKIPATRYKLLPYDMYILKAGLFKAIEFKVEENTPAAHQIMYLDEVAKNGGQAWVVTQRESRIIAELLNTHSVWTFDSKAKTEEVVQLVVNHVVTDIDKATVEQVKRNILEG